MFQRPKLNNEEDASPGGGAPQPMPASPTATEGAAPNPPALSADDVRGMLTEFQNGFFANARRAGMLAKEKPAPATSSTATAPAEVHAAAPAARDVSSEVEYAVSRMRAFERAAAQAGLNDRQTARMEESLRAVKPENVSEWARGYLEDLGLGKTNTSPPVSQPATLAPAPAVAAQPQASPVRTPSDKGPATAGDQRDVDSILTSRPSELTRYDIDRLNLKHGVAKAQEMIRDSMNLYLRSVKLTPDRRRS